MNLSESTVPKVVADKMREMEPWHGVTGMFKFDKNGDLLNRSILIKNVENKTLKFYKK